jgi:hypothetical protein
MGELGRRNPRLGGHRGAARGWLGRRTRELAQPNAKRHQFHRVDRTGQQVELRGWDVPESRLARPWHRLPRRPRVARVDRDDAMPYQTRQIAQRRQRSSVRFSM